MANNFTFTQQDMVSVLNHEAPNVSHWQHKHLYQETWLQMNQEFTFQCWWKCIEDDIIITETGGEVDSKVPWTHYSQNRR